jgi:hypothetical protein
MQASGQGRGLSSAISLARALLALARTHATGVLHVTAETGSCALAIVNGVVRAASALPGRDQPLGDALINDGALDVEAHARALEQAAPQGPIGEYLVASGLTTRPALELALRRQLRDRVVELFAQRTLEYRFEAGSSEIGVPQVSEPMTSADLVLSALRARLVAWSHAQLCAVLPDGPLQLTTIGHALIRRAALWPDEAAVVSLLRRGTTLDRVVETTSGSARALRMLALLTLVAGIATNADDRGRYSLLVRKRAQLARAEDAHALLDLPPDAPLEDGRRALRRIARDLHPDTLGPHASDALRRASNEVLGALIDAERNLRDDHFS